MKRVRHDSSHGKNVDNGERARRIALSALTFVQHQWKENVEIVNKTMMNAKFDEKKKEKSLEVKRIRIQ